MFVSSGVGWVKRSEPIKAVQPTQDMQPDLLGALCFTQPTRLNGYKEVVKKLSSLRNDGLAISIISLAELYEGVYTQQDQLRMKKN